MNKTVKIALIVVAALAVAGVGGSWVYINLVKDEAPAALDFVDTTSTTAAAGASTTVADEPAAASNGVEGDWVVGEGSQVGYRVKEILFGQDSEGVGRTRDVTGGLTISGTTVTATEFSVDMTTVESDESRRDRAFRGDIMDVATFPTATFELGEPIELGSVPADGVEMPITAQGVLTLRGTSKDVELSLTAKRTADTIQVLGRFEVGFADWGIPNPSRGPVSTEDRGQLEVLLVFRRA